MRSTILQLKASYFYGINQQKLKALILENEQQRREMQLMRQELERSLVEKDFLERNNRLLKSQYEFFTMHYVHSSRPYHSRLKTEQSRTTTNDYEMRL